MFDSVQPGETMNVFVLHHTHEFLDGEDDVKLAGVYSTEASAQYAIAELLKSPGFSEHPDGFEISAYGLDETRWREGFLVKLD